MTEIRLIRLTVEAGAPSKEALITILTEQAKRFFGDEEFRQDGPIRCEVETVVAGTAAGDRVFRWSGNADFVNWREEEGERRWR